MLHYSNAIIHVTMGKHIGLKDLFVSLFYSRTKKRLHKLYIYTLPTCGFEPINLTIKIYLRLECNGHSYAIVGKF